MWRKLSPLSVRPTSPYTTKRKTRKRSTCGPTIFLTTVSPHHHFLAFFLVPSLGSKYNNTIQQRTRINLHRPLIILSKHITNIHYISLSSVLCLMRLTLKNLPYYLLHSRAPAFVIITTYLRLRIPALPPNGGSPLNRESTRLSASWFFPAFFFIPCRPWQRIIFD